MKKFLMCLMLFFIQNVLAAGFQGGNSFSAEEVFGQLQVSCPQSSPGPNVAFANCYADILNAGEYAYFSGPVIDADTVTLRAQREDGSQSKLKSEKYNGAKGVSRKPFNLWISTVFQRPLLGIGSNIVTYSLLKDGKTVETGKFSAMVGDGGRYNCRSMGYYISQSSMDCQNPELLCSRYFSEHNYCH